MSTGDLGEKFLAQRAPGLRSREELGHHKVHRYPHISHRGVIDLAWTLANSAPMPRFAPVMNTLFLLVFVCVSLFGFIFVAG